MRKIIGRLVLFVCACAMLGTSVFAAQSPAGYIYNPETTKLAPYYETPEEVIPQREITEEDLEMYVNPITPHGFNRYCIAYSPKSYSYDYNNERFKIGVARVDNTKNKYESADLIFVATQSSSVGFTLTLGVECGGEVDAVFSKVSAKYRGEVATNVSWSAGETVQTGTKVPPGKIGRVTAYVIGVYTAGTATYRVLNTTTDEMWDEACGIGVLVPTTNAWNMVVEVPSN